MKYSLVIAAAAIALAFGTSSAQAASCDPGKAGYDLTAEEAEKVYDCLKQSLVDGYKKGNKRWIPKEIVDDYRNWALVTKFPAAPGFHGGRFLMTYVNAVGADTYMEYKEEDVVVPSGTLIAKESFSVSDEGKVRKGPLFIMQKVDKGKSPKTNDWYYMMVAPNGAPLAVNVYKACSECHMENFGHQGELGYPTPDARVHKN